MLVFLIVCAPKSNRLIDECAASKQNSFSLILISVRELGKFHGECYALKESNRGLFHVITKAFKESRYARTPDRLWAEMATVCPRRGTQAIRENSELNRIVPEEFLKQIEKQSDRIWEYWPEAVKPREPLATICHGDFLRNNIAFQFDDKVIRVDRLWKQTYMFFSLGTARTSPSHDV